MDPQQLAEHVATQFKKYREKAGMTQAEVAIKAGVTVETVARLERVLRGRSSANANPSLETLARLSYALGIEPLALLRDVIKTPENDALSAVLLGASPSVRELLAVLGRALIERERRFLETSKGVKEAVGMALRATVAHQKPAKKKPRKR